MTAPTAPFNLRTARQLAAQIVSGGGHPDDAITKLEELHTRIFAALGNTADKVAATLTELGIKGSLPEVVQDGAEVYGDLTDDEGNALAVLLREVCGAHSASVFATGAILCWRADDGEELAHEDVDLPEALCRFQTEYEDFRYPALYNAPVPTEVTEYQNDTREGIARFEHTTRGPVREVTDRRGHSEPMPQELVDAIGAAGLTADDFGDQVHLHRDGQLWAMVHGSDHGGRYSLWSGEYGFLRDQGPMNAYQGLKTFDNRNDGVRYVLANIDTPRLINEQVEGGRWRRGPLTGDSRHVRIATDTLLATMKLGYTLDQVGGSLNLIEVYYAGTLMATAGMIPGGTWESKLTDGRTVTAPNMDDVLISTFEALATP